MDEPQDFPNLCRLASYDIGAQESGMNSVEQTASRVLIRAAVEIENLRKAYNKLNFKHGTKVRENQKLLREVKRLNELLQKTQ